MAISSIGSSGLSALTLANQRSSPAEMAKKMVKDLDGDQDGSVSKAEFIAGAEKMKAQAPTAAGGSTPKPPSGTNAPTRPSADQLFAAADQNGDQSLSVDELSSLLAAGEAHAKTAAGGKHGGAGAPGGAPPAGGGGPPRAMGAAGGSKSASSSSDSSSTTSSSSTDPADTNKDGVVSAAEKLIYNLTHSSSSSTTDSSSTSQTSTSGS